VAILALNFVTGATEFWSLPITIMDHQHAILSTSTNLLVKSTKFLPSSHHLELHTNNMVLSLLPATHLLPVILPVQSALLLDQLNSNVHKQLLTHFHTKINFPLFFLEVIIWRSDRRLPASSHGI
jgi:hypothetical protein